MPVEVGPGDDVVGATINGNGRLIVFVTTVGARTRLAEIVRLLEAAQGSTAPIQRVADRVSSVLVPIVIAIAAGTLLGWLTLTDASSGASILHAVAVLLIACPCALGLATPAAIMTGTGRAAELGLLFKGGEVFEAVRAADVVLLDKTGTITDGVMSVVEIVPAEGVDPDTVIALAAAAEQGSEHPIARAVIEAAGARGAVAPSSTSTGSSQERRRSRPSGATRFGSDARVTFQPISATPRFASPQPGARHSRCGGLGLRSGSWPLPIGLSPRRQRRCNACGGWGSRWRW